VNPVTWAQPVAQVHSCQESGGDVIDRLTVYLYVADEGEEKAVMPLTDMMIGEVGERWFCEDGFLHSGYYVVLGGEGL